ncbi:phosphatidylinositol 3,4,5-trisphosphate 3-phosphatase TPTE2 [Galendromus occidentalis]|uniref:Phosphatidylinositol 3,4,5-trisphosphate 3-phosphatase TPTE2 n=1 Tax=Galendromus occidentalis TaxID=34638 RepID=A0AAJ6QVS0_9ACAR|nr:phosphatidylinositol 3,4,5-trisphosphate 3-phosphatase TPTE2 [Galendromus occidentalis]
MPSYDRFNNDSNNVSSNNDINNKRNRAGNDDSDDHTAGSDGGKDKLNNNISSVAETRLSMGVGDYDKTADDGGHKLNTDALNQTPLEHHILRRIVHHLAFRLLSLILILIDIAILIASLRENPEGDVQRTYNYIAMAFSVVFIAELCLRVYTQGTSDFFSKWYNKVDFCIIALTFVGSVSVLLITDLKPIHRFQKAVVLGRLVRIVGFVRFMRFYTEKKNLTKGARHVISENKRRFQQDGFDLDLVYVTSRIVAMSYPSSGKMSWYRNPIQDVERFFRTKHPKHYMVCNMCSERTYDDSHFEGRILRLSIDDHNVPLLAEALSFINKAQAFLDEDPDNVIAIHCKGGKGRTGTLICMLLINNNVFESAKESLQYFGEVRTDLTVGTKFQGVETPSQNRYVEYFEQIKNNFSMQMPAPVTMKVTHIKIWGIGGLGKGNGSDLRCEVFEGRSQVFDMNFGECRNCRVIHDPEANSLTVSAVNFPVVKGDVKFRFYSNSLSVPKGYENCAFFFWFHTSFIDGDSLSLHRDVLDNPHKKKTWTSFGDDMIIELKLARQ